ncbi:MAG: sigma-70 family RNA polymerase sigma factor [Sphingobacteriaceae bacterium]|nr:sigma-70 family RNA polymerase sigma factor [Sphingobacteriaceae bacterium]
MDELGNTDKLTTKAVYDYKLVQSALNNGDQKAYAELLHRYRESVYFMMLKMVNNKDDADDLTIEAFGRAFKRLSQYTPNFAFSTWLFKIASNNAIDHLRKKKQGESYSLDTKYVNDEGQQLSQTIKSGTLDPEEHFMKKQKIEMLNEVVDKLKPKYKELVVMFYYQEMSHEEISQKLNLPIGTIKAQLFSAREFLYNILKNKESNM